MINNIIITILCFIFDKIIYYIDYFLTIIAIIINHNLKYQRRKLHLIVVEADLSMENGKICFERSEKIDCSSGSVSFQTLKFCRYKRRRL